MELLQTYKGMKVICWESLFMLILQQVILFDEQRVNNLNPLYILANFTRRYTTQFDVYSQFSSHHLSIQETPT